MADNSIYYSDEIWKYLSNLQNYSISSYGRLKNRSGKILKSHDCGNGYYFYRLSDKGKLKNYFVHRLVAMEFIKNPLNKAQVNHIDGNRNNNILSNLEWMTPSENNKHSYEKLGRKNPSTIYSRPIISVHIRTHRITNYPSIRQAVIAINGSKLAIRRRLGLNISYKDHMWDDQKKVSGK